MCVLCAFVNHTCHKTESHRWVLVLCHMLLLKNSAGASGVCSEAGLSVKKKNSTIFSLKCVCSFYLPRQRHHAEEQGSDRKAPAAWLSSSFSSSLSSEEAQRGASGRFPPPTVQGSALIQRGLLQTKISFFSAAAQSENQFRSSPVGGSLLQG